MIVAERKIRETSYRQQNNDVVKRQQKDKRRKKKLRTILRIGVILALGVVITSRFAIISEYAYRMDKLENQLSELRKVNERLNLQIAQAQDITWIEDYARNQLGMVYPDNRDIIYVAVDRTDEEKLAQENTEEDYTLKGWAAILAGKIGGFLSGD